MKSGKPVLPGLRNALWLLVLPIAFLVLHGVFTAARGPFYLRPTVDPDYAYLFNALNIARKKAPHHVDHPGTTLQSSSAVVIRAMHPLTRRRDLAETVLCEPERHLQWINWSLAGVYFVFLIGAGLWVWRQTAQRLPALLMQATPFLLGGYFGVTTRVSAEPMLLIIGIVMATLLYLDSLQTRTRLSVVVALAFATAAGIVTKLTFVPLAVVAFICLRTWKQRAICALSTVIFAALLLKPAAEHIDRIMDWATRLSLRQQRYGSGDLGLLPGNYFANLTQLIIEHPWATLTVSMSWLAFLRRLGTHGQDQPQAVRWLRLLGALSCGETLQMLLVAKYAQWRYLVPTVMLCPLNALLLLQLAQLQWRNHRWWLPIRKVAIAAACIGVLTAAWHLRTQYVELSQVMSARAEIARMLPGAFKDETVVLIGVASSPYYALWFGNFWAGAHYTTLLRDEVLANHRSFYLLEGDNHIYLGGKRVGPLAQFARQHGSFILWGNGRHEARIASQLPAGSNLEKLDERQGEAIFRVTLPRPNESGNERAERVQLN